MKNRSYAHIILILHLVTFAISNAEPRILKTLHRSPFTEEDIVAFSSADYTDEIPSFIVVEDYSQDDFLWLPAQEILDFFDVRSLEQRSRVVFQNIVVSNGHTDVTHFTSSAALDNAMRDSHVIDAYNGVIAWAWTDNSTVKDKTNGTMNVMVTLGTANSAGQAMIGKPINLTNFTTGGLQAWDTAVAINRTNSKNIVVSYLLINYNTGVALPYRAVSLDGGKTWKNGPMNVAPTGKPREVGDNRGVACDKFGNFWYSATNLYNSNGKSINQPYFAVSSDGGVTFKLAYTTPLLPDFKVGTSEYDYPQFCFGGNGLGGYGVWFTTDYYQDGANITPVVGFIPVTGHGKFGAGNLIELTHFKNTQYVPCLAASLDGKVWCEAINYSVGTTKYPVATRFKSPGALNANYQGPWTVAQVDSAFANGAVHEISQPSRGYFNVTVQSNVYDEKRKALYTLVTDQVSHGSQNMQIQLYVSRNNGQKWSAPVNVATTNVGNRGFASMALDPVTGNLIMGWYDGRNDATFHSVEYFGLIISSANVDSLVATAPLA